MIKRCLHLFFVLVLISQSAFAQKIDMDLLKGMKPRAIGPAAMSGRVTAVDVVAKELFSKIILPLCG